MSALLLSADLVVASRVTSVAREISLPIAVVARGDAVVAQALNSSARLIVIDLTTPGLRIEALVSELRGPSAWDGTIIAFGPHVDEAGLQTARRAGCDKVLARGRFLNQLAAILLPFVRVEMPGHATRRDRDHDVADVS